MNYLMKPSALLIVTSLLAVSAQAQQKNDKEEALNNKTIIIKPNEGNKQKFTIVIDGSNVTVNGKAVDEFKGSGITITEDNTPQFRIGRALPGGWNMVDDENVRPQNKALLGVATEENAKGAMVKNVNKESAAEKAGLKEGDIITKVNDEKIETPVDLQNVISKLEPGDKVKIFYIRGGKSQTANAELTKNETMSIGQRKGFKLDGSQWGMPGFDFDRNDRTLRFTKPGGFEKPKLGLELQDQESGKGVKVMDIVDESAAEKAGFKNGDIITTINGKDVNSVAEVKRELSNSKDSPLKIGYLRNNKSQTADIKFPKKLEKAQF